MALPTHSFLLPRSRFSTFVAAGLVLCLAALWRALPDADGLPQGQRLLIRRATLIDPARGLILKDQDLMIEDGRIQSIGRDLDYTGQPELIEAQGLYVTPALVDAAVFLSLEGRFPTDSVPATALQSLRRQALAGVAAVLDLNAHRSFMQQARELRGVLPKAAFAGALITAPGGWRLPGQTPWDSHVVETEESADLDTPWSRSLRFRDQALFASVEHEGRDGLGLPLEVLKRLGQLAHERGLPFIVHSHHAGKALQALEADPDAVLGPLLDLEEAPGLAVAMRQRGTVYLPALSSLLNSQPPKALAAWFASLPLGPPMGAAAWVKQSDEPKARSWANYWARQKADQAKALGVPKALADAGVTLGLGTASGLPMVFHGLGLQSEWAHWTRAGLSPAQALRASDASRALLGLEKPLRRGSRADLLLLDRDPLTDPTALLHPVRVLLGGQETGL